MAEYSNPFVINYMLYLSTNADKVFVEEPFVQSRASYLFLRDQMQKIVMEEWETFRNEIFDEFEAIHGELICQYCGAEHLVREILDPCDKAQLKTLATIDHIVALSLGGSKWDKSNCTIACHPCNNHKKNKTSYRNVRVL
ncbi:MAG: HNH endonuclease [Candidatus Nanoarchaeia archaeon]|jgi:5-methylcytosine-specific restriction endonuclease McrA|nr:HNH endonuclease [Candidatus Nanoarchaeia archaeon]